MNKLKNEKNIKLRLRTLGEVELKYISTSDAKSFLKILSEEKLSDREFVIKILHNQLIKPKINFEELKKPHKSYLRNPIIANVFYLAGYIEQFGSGTIRMVEWMKEKGLPEPEYREEMGGFSVYFYKDIYTEEYLKKLGLNERHIKAVMYVKEKGKISNKEYRELFNISRQTATRDLSKLVQKEILKLVGEGKRDLHYVFYESKKSQ